MPQIDGIKKVLKAFLVVFFLALTLLTLPNANICQFR